MCINCVIDIEYLQVYYILKWNTYTSGVKCKALKKKKNIFCKHMIFHNK